MKNFLLFCFFLSFLVGTARAQDPAPVSKTEFQSLLQSFNSLASMGDPATTPAFSGLTGMIKNEVFYMEWRIMNARNKYVADSIRAANDLRTAQAATPDRLSPKVIEARNFAQLVSEELPGIQTLRDRKST